MIKSESIELPVPTAEGVFLARYSEKGLAELSFPKPGQSAGQKVNPSGIATQVLRWHRLTTDALQKNLTGRAPKTLPPLDLVGTEFQKSVWAALLQIAFGKTRSYGEIAAAIGRPKAVRAVGSACGANPIPILVPCHRVLAANNQLGGFTSGLPWKRKLLQLEGV